ncbi:MAG: nucleoside transporter C-terminal domain-containing protein [Candidatus Babeliales bacterium]|nr:nucleoside transporter C-terminal domain-containing protein [Candidatus Babeliales bacterium]
MIFDYLIQYNRYMNILGIFAILLIAFCFSKHKRKIKLKLVFSALGLQFLIGIAVLKTNSGQRILDAIANGINNIYGFATVGTTFVFGNLTNADSAWGFIFAFKILPIIIFFGALTSVLFHFGIIQFFVGIINKLIRPILGTSGAETLCAIANSFLGQTESPLLIRNYLHNMTKSEIFVVMVSGMATISGSILVVFSSMGVPAKHMLAASVMAIPASILIAKIIYPETETSHTIDGADVTFEKKSTNVFDAIGSGTSDGLWLAINVGAMLIVFISLIALLNAMLESLLHINLGFIFSKLFLPFSYLLGFESTDATKAAELLGTKVTINELVAYSKMVTMNLSERTQIIMTYALCGFSNFSCIGIQLGGIGALVPEKKQWLSELGLLTVFASSLANILSALVAAIII